MGNGDRPLQEPPEESGAGVCPAIQRDAADAGDTGDVAENDWLKVDTSLMLPYYIQDGECIYGSWAQDASEDYCAVAVQLV